MRTEEWPTNEATFGTRPRRSSEAQVLGIALEVPLDAGAQRLERHALDVGQVAQREVAVGRRGTGAMVKPQLPITTLVTPSATDGVANGSQMSCAS